LALPLSTSPDLRHPSGGRKSSPEPEVGIGRAAAAEYARDVLSADAAAVDAAANLYRGHGRPCLRGFYDHVTLDDTMAKS
jgi:hypothetical protein